MSLASEMESFPIRFDNTTLDITTLDITTKMLPPTEDSVLRSNPKFAVLHATLTKSLLNADGSTKNHSHLREHEAAAEVCAWIPTTVHLH